VLPAPGLGRMIIFCNMASLYIFTYIWWYEWSECDCGLCYAHDAWFFPPRFVRGHIFSRVTFLTLMHIVMAETAYHLNLDDNFVPTNRCTPLLRFESLFTWHFCAFFYCTYKTIRRGMVCLFRNQNLSRAFFLRPFPDV
jgi:hypothetical protein